MKLYYAPGTCSLASHITLEESGAPYEVERANIRAKTTESGGNFLEITPRGAVPVLLLDTGEVLTEGVAIMQYVADSLNPGSLPAQGTLARARLQEALNFLSTEIHKSYSPLFRGIEGDVRAAQIALLNARLGIVERWLSDGRAWIVGADYTPADAYFFTLTNWSKGFGHDLSTFPKIISLREKIAARPAVQAAMRAEGML
jgi:glutathione S-transferase